MVSSSHLVDIPHLSFIPGLVSAMESRVMAHFLMGALPAALGSPRVSLRPLPAWATYSPAGPFFLTCFIGLCGYRAEGLGPGVAPHPELSCDMLEFHRGHTQAPSETMASLEMESRHDLG